MFFFGRRYSGTDITLHNLSLVGSGGDGRGYDQQYRQGYDDSLFRMIRSNPLAAQVTHPLTVTWQGGGHCPFNPYPRHLVWCVDGEGLSQRDAGRDDQRAD